MKALTTNQLFMMRIAVKGKAREYEDLAAADPKNREYWEGQRDELLKLADTLEEIRDRVYYSKEMKTRIYFTL